jgi:hypothetical protein
MRIMCYLLYNGLGTKDPDPKCPVCSEKLRFSECLPVRIGTDYEMVSYCWCPVCFATENARALTQ